MIIIIINANLNIENQYSFVVTFTGIIDIWQKLFLLVASIIHGIARYNLSGNSLIRAHSILWLRKA